jgi:uncharacterized membrane protein YagU involved in acid resistance
MNWMSALLWGFAATAVMTTLMSMSLGLGFSRMSLPLVLGTLFTPDRQRAPILGFAVHFVNGWLFAFVYGLAFESIGRATWWLGGLFGLVHGLTILVAVLPLLDGIHPRMASETTGPEPTRNLEPPGFMALNYGRSTPAVTLLAHLAYGIILGAFYQLPG